jgi:hypothetical protein
MYQMYVQTTSCSEKYFKCLQDCEIKKIENINIYILFYSIFFSSWQVILPPPSRKLKSRLLAAFWQAPSPFCILWSSLRLLALSANLQSCHPALVPTSLAEEKKGVKFS